MNLESAVQKIRRFFRKNKRLPSYQEMCRLFGFSSKGASFKLAAKLIEAGILGKDSTGKLMPKQLFPSLPVLGIIRAGSPTAAEEQLLSAVSFDDYLIARPERSYLLRVSGDSMIEAGIHEGDMVIVEKGLPFFTRSVNMGGDQLTHQMMSQMKLEREAAEKMKRD